MKMKEVFQGKLNFFLFIFAKMLRFILFYWLVHIIFSKGSLISEYNFNHVAIVYFTFNVIDVTAQTLFREVYRFRETLTRGGLDGTLLKPHHPFAKVLLGGTDLIDLITLAPYTLFLLYFASRLYITPESVLLYVMLCLNALVIATAFHIAALSVCIVTHELEQVMWTYRDLTGFGRFPFEIYQEPLRGFLTFVIPVGIMMSFPAKALFGLLSFQYILIAFAIAGISLFLALRFWHFALKRYQSYGG